MFNLYKYIIKEWLVTRMAAQEFYFKSPFEINEEYAIMKSILFFALVPFELLIIFTYARVFGSLSNYTWSLIILIALINLAVSNLTINGIKDSAFIRDVISEYEKTDYEERRNYYSFKKVAKIVNLTVLGPWCFLLIGVLIVCRIFPH